MTESELDNALVAQKNLVFEEIQKLRDRVETFQNNPCKHTNGMITQQHELLLTLFTVLAPVWRTTNYYYKLDEVRAIVSRIVEEVKIN